MSLARLWTRQLYGAWGAALLAPATMIAALAVLAFGGSFGGFSALGQLLSGPAVPAGLSLPGGQVAPAAATTPLPVVPASTPTAAAAALRAVGSSPGGEHPGTGGASGGGSRPSGSGGGGTGRFGGGGHGVAPPLPKTPPPPTPTPAPPTPAPTPTGPVTSVVNKVLGVGEAVTGALPAPVAQIGTGTLQSLGQTLTKLLPGL